MLHRSQVTEHQFDPQTEACVHCGTPRMDAEDQEGCKGGIKPHKWLLLTPQGPAWVETRATIPHLNIPPQRN
jgi:hypothetical protein